MHPHAQAADRLDPKAWIIIVTLAIGWHSDRLAKDHTPAQVVAGTILGTVTAGMMYWLIA